MPIDIVLKVVISYHGIFLNVRHSLVTNFCLVKDGPLKFFSENNLDIKGNIAQTC